MRGFDIEQLRTFTAVAESGSFTAAAPRVFLSQSAVSEQIRKLEEAAGSRLLERGRAGARPTPAGERLLAHARRILASSDAAYRDLRGTPLAGELRLAITDYFRPADIAQCLRRLHDDYPQLRLHVTIAKSGTLEQGYAAGAYDVGLTMRVAAPDTGRAAAGALPLRREPLAWMAADGWSPPRGLPLPLLALPDSCSLHRYAVGLLVRRKVPYTLAHLASGVAGLQQAVAAGLGVACLNLSALPAGTRPLLPGRRLPALPAVEFQLLGPRKGESPVVAAARALLARQWA